jgi:signal transduction histidine kinase
VSTLLGWQGLPSDSIVLIVVILVVAQLIIRDQILEPNLILNVQLARANAELIRANKRKSEFLAVISHELRTPLGAVISYTEMMLLNAYGPLNERQTEQLNKIGESGHYLLGMIGNVLDLSKVEAGQMRLNILPINAQERISAVLKTLLLNPKEQGGITIFCDIAPTLPPVSADPQQFDKIMRSLLLSSLAQLRVGTLTVRAEQENKAIKFTVSHTGTGFTPEQLAHLFDPTHANLPNESTQLELAIAAQLVHLHGGTLRAESDGILGQGVTFQFALPIHPIVEPMLQQIISLTPEIAS